MSPLTLILTVALLQTHPAMPKGMSHEEHLQQMKKDEELKKRGADAMGFDQDATTHHFSLTATGGSIEVTVKSQTDAALLAAVRDHLKAIEEAFTHGQFDKPFQTHNEVPPGVPEMKTLNGAISYRYEEVMNGAVVRIETKDVRALQAVHNFLRYQIREHQTGDTLDVKR